MKSIKNCSTSTALLLFAQSKSAESISKPIAYRKSKTVLLWEKMNERVLKTIQSTNLPYFISDEKSQIGDTFGEKITHAIQDVFNKGFENVIVIGNDCIELKAHHLKKAFSELQKNEMVLAPDSHGGAYLIGVSKAVFNVDKFSSIPWKTAFVLDELQLLFNERALALLPRLNDCNSTSDFKKVIYKLPFSNSFRNLILSLLQNATVPNQYKTSLVSYNLSTLFFNKGSPLSI